MDHETPKNFSDIKHITVALEDCPIYEAPGALFKFCDENGLKILLNGILKITPPRDFNDPFEFAPGIDPQLAVHPPSMVELERHFLEPAGFPRAVYSSKHTHYEKWVREVALKRPDLLVNHVCCMREAISVGISNSYGVACFSAFTKEEMESASTVRHWAAYANDHRGLVIEFDGTHSFFALKAKSKWLFPVKYKESRPFCRLSEFEDMSAPSLVRTLRIWAETKSENAWGTENEWRLIAPLSDTTQVPVSCTVVGERLLHCLHIWPSDCAFHDSSVVEAAKAIRRVILGSRASLTLEASVRNLLSRPHLEHVALCRSRENRSNFSLEIVRI